MASYPRTTYELQYSGGSRDRNHEAGTDTSISVNPPIKLMVYALLPTNSLPLRALTDEEPDHLLARLRNVLVLKGSLWEHQPHSCNGQSMAQHPRIPQRSPLQLLTKKRRSVSSFPTMYLPLTTTSTALADWTNGTWILINVPTTWLKRGSDLGSS